MRSLPFNIYATSKLQWADHLSSVVSVEEFRKYVGVTSLEIENKVGRISSNEESLKIKYKKCNSLIPNAYQRSPRNFHLNAESASFGLTAHEAELRFSEIAAYQFDSNLLISSAYPAYYGELELERLFYSITPCEITKFDLQRSNDEALIRSLKSRFGDNWEYYYLIIIEVKNFFSSLKHIEDLIFDKFNDEYHSADSTFKEYKYLDLVSTMSEYELNFRKFNYSYSNITYHEQSRFKYNK